MTPIQAIERLKSCGWTQAEIGKAVNVEQSSISRILGGADPKHSLAVALIELAKTKRSRKA